MKYYALFWKDDRTLDFLVVDKPSETEGRDAILRMLDFEKIVLHFPESELGRLRILLESAQTPAELDLTDPGPEHAVSKDKFKQVLGGNTPSVATLHDPRVQNWQVPNPYEHGEKLPD